MCSDVYLCESRAWIQGAAPGQPCGGELIKYWDLPLSAGHSPALRSQQLLSYTPLWERMAVAQEMAEAAKPLEEWHPAGFSTSQL